MKFCKHYRGMDFSNRNNGCFKCKAGIEVRQFTGGSDFGWLKRIPCNPDNNSVISCHKFELLSKEEIEKEEKDFERVLQAITSIQPVITKLRNDNPNGIIEVINCPICSKQLSIGISGYNGHASGTCETDDCISFME